MFAKEVSKQWLILFVALALAFGVTIPKLYKMAKIMGWVDGAIVTKKVVTQKGVEPSKRQDREDSYWLSWVHGDVGDSWTRRVRVPEEVWQETEVGDEIDLIEIPGDNQPYLRNDIFVEPGQFILDYIILAGELITALVMAILIYIHFRRSRTPADVH